MGWSCSRDAGQTLERFSAACFRATGQTNVYQEQSKLYLAEVSSEEHRDGAITGETYLLKSNGLCSRLGQFRIEPDGQVSLGPAALKAVAAQVPALPYARAAG